MHEIEPTQDKAASDGSENDIDKNQLFEFCQTVMSPAKLPTPP